MSRNILVFYGSYRRDRQGIKLARWIVESLRARGDKPELIDAMKVDLPMLDRRFSDYKEGDAPPAMADLAARISAADGFIFVAGEYNGGLQPGLKNLTDHFLEQYYWRPVAIASYSAGPFAGIKSATAWRGTLAVMGMVVTSTGLSLARIGGAFDPDGKPMGEDGGRLEKAFPRFADDLNWWVDAAKTQRANGVPPY